MDIQIKSQIEQLELNNDVDSHLQLGKIYSAGPFEFRDYPKAISHYVTAAKAGCADAAYYLGKLYSRANGIKADYTLARQYFEQAAGQNHGGATFELGQMHFLGQGVPINKELTYKLLDKAKIFLDQECEQGKDYGFCTLGYMHQLGIGVEKDDNRARELMEQAAELGNCSALKSLGSIYKHGKGVEKDEAKSMEYYKKAADAFDVSAICTIGSLYYEAQDFDLAYEYYKKAAEFNDSYALYQLGVMYERGEGVDKDQAKCIEYTKKSADLGYARANADLGFIYDRGIGVAQDYAKAFECYKKAVEQGSGIGMRYLGELYCIGCYVKQDFVKAKQLYEQAAEFGDVESKLYLAQLYLFGNGCRQSDDKAFRIVFDFLLEGGKNESLYKQIVDPSIQETSVFQAAYDCYLFFSGYYTEAFNNLLKSKCKNIPVVSYALGLMYSFGLGTDVNLDKGREFISFSLASKYAGAMSINAYFYDQQGMTRQAFDWYKQSNENNGRTGRFVVGFAKWLGILVKSNIKQGLFLMKSEVNNPCVLGLFLSGQFALDEFLEGIGVDANLAISYFEQALNWVKRIRNPYTNGSFCEILKPTTIESWLNYAQLIKSMSLNSSAPNILANLESLPEFVKLQKQSQDLKNPIKYLATYLLGSFHLQNEQSLQQALSLLDGLAQQALETNDYILAAAAFKLGCYYEQHHNLLQALTYFKLAAHPQGLPCFDLRNVYRIKALQKLIKLTSHGEVTEESLVYYQHALEIGLVEPCYKLGQYYQNQRPTDLENAITAYQVAAEGGIAQAQYDLAQIYHNDAVHIDHTKARKLYEEALEQGMLEAVIPLGEIYELGQGCTADLTKAFNLYLQACNEGLAEAQYRVGQCYLHGKGIEVSAQKALLRFEQAANQDHIQALRTMGQIYETGEHVTRDIDKATNLYSKASALGDELSKVALAKLQLSTGGDNNQELLQQLLSSGNYEEVLNFHLKHLDQAIISQDNTLLDSSLAGIKDLADQDILMAQVALAQYYETLKTHDALQQAQFYYQLAAEQGHVPSFLAVAKATFAEQDYEQAFKWLSAIEDAAKQAVNKLPCGYTVASTCNKVTSDNTTASGFLLKDYRTENWEHDYAEAGLLLAKCYESGLGVEQNGKLAYELYSKASNAGVIEARLTVALLLLHGGDGVKTDERQAITLLNKLVKRKYAPAQLELGKLYLNGQGVKADTKQAFTLIKSAADQKLPEAMAKLSELYEKGIGIAANPKQAQSYLNKAKALGWSC